MKFEIQSERLANAFSISRQIGYIYQREDKKRNEVSLVRLLERSGYPRFHIYLKLDLENKAMIFNLHLDQKRPVYEGSKAHSGEYEGEAVEQEAEAIKKLLAKN